MVPPRSEAQDIASPPPPGKSREPWAEEAVAGSSPSASDAPAPAPRTRATAEPARQVLFISYPFPPVGGAGVQRVTKFLKYLPAHGWRASVLTVDNPSVPVFDESLLRDVPADALIRRARTWEPHYGVKSAIAPRAKGSGSAAGGLSRVARRLVHASVKLLLQPDPQVLWLPNALREGLRLLREVPHAAIVASGPPFSTFLIGSWLSRRTGVPLVLDYRDEWDISSACWENKRLDPVSHWVQRRMQHAVVRSARALLATTRSSAEALEAVRQRARSAARVECVYNGFDPDDFPPGAPAPRPGPYRLAYVGTLWNLTSVAPLVEAIAGLAHSSPQMAADLEVAFAGRRTDAQQALLDRLKQLPCKVLEYPYLDHREALDLLRSADGLCVLMSDLPYAHRVVPAKIFEYMAARRPVLGIGPPGEMWDLLRKYPAAYLYRPADTEGIRSWLARAIERRRAGQQPQPLTWEGAEFSRPNQAGQLAALLESL